MNRLALVAFCFASSLPVRAMAEPSGWTAQELSYWLPKPLLGTGPRRLLWWQWLAFPVLVLIGWVFGRLLGWLTRRIVGSAVSPERRELLRQATGPIVLFGNVLFVRVFLASLALEASAEDFVLQFVKAGFLVSIFWALWRTIDVASRLTVESAWARSNAAALGLLPAVRRMAKIATAAMAVIAVLAELGYPVASLLAGLGIGGLALALAAQKTVENLIGSVAIGVDQPFRVGDVVRIENVVGTVEAIGLRSTRIRTPDRTVVTYPNGKLADIRTETFGPRDRIVLNSSIYLPLDATAQQVQAVIGGIEGHLLATPAVYRTDPPLVRLSELTSSAMKIDLGVAFATTDWTEYTRLRQETFLAILQIVERAGTRLTPSTQTVQLTGTATDTTPKQVVAL
jgi:MscS family membrane protein